MTKYEFLRRLRESLENELNAREVQENLDYYSSYISDEVKKGRSEQEVLDELGDPWVIAQSVIAASENRLEPETGHREERGKEQKNTGHSQNSGWGGYTGGPHVYTFGTTSRWKGILAVIAILLVIIAVFAIIGGLLSLIMPVLLPICAVIVIVRLLVGRRR